jgi:hypothetical protein
VKHDGAFVPREPIDGMPDELADAIYTYDAELQEDLLANWQAIGDDGRAVYRAYLAKAHTRIGRRDRAQLAAMQLLHPDQQMPSGADGSGLGM